MRKTGINPIPASKAPGSPRECFPPRSSRTRRPPRPRARLQAPLSGSPPRPPWAFPSRGWIRGPHPLGAHHHRLEDHGKPRLPGPKAGQEGEGQDHPVPGKPCPKPGRKEEKGRGQGPEEVDQEDLWSSQRSLSLWKRASTLALGRITCSVRPTPMRSPSSL